MYIDGKLVLDMAGKHNPLEGHINFETGAVDVYGLNKDGATEDGYPINKNQHHAPVPFHTGPSTPPQMPLHLQDT